MRTYFRLSGDTRHTCKSQLRVRDPGRGNWACGQSDMPVPDDPRPQGRDLP